MKRPTWATVVGILGVIFGALGILGGAFEMMMPRMLKMQRELVQDIREEFRRQTVRDRRHADTTRAPAKQPTAQTAPHAASPDTAMPPEAIFDMLDDMCRTPPWFERWSAPMGITRMVISLAYLLAAIALLQVKRYGIRLFYVAAGAALLLAAIKLGIGAATDSMFLMSILMGAALTAAIDLVLLVVVATGDKRAFSDTAPPPLPI